MVTLDIEDTLIKMVVMNGTTFEMAVSSILEPGLVEGGLILDKDAVSNKIRSLMDAHHVSEKQVVVCISGLNSIYRTFNIPKLPGKLMEQAVKREAERVLPVSPDEIYISWQAISISNEQNLVCVVGSPRSIVDAMMETLHKAGLKPKIVDIRPLAAARISNENDALIVNYGKDGFDIVIMQNGIVELLRSLSFSKQDMSDEEKAATLAAEVERTVKFHNSSHKQNPVNEHTTAFVGGDHVESLLPYLDFVYKPLPALLSYQEGFDASSYMVNIGLVLHSTRVSESKSIIKINALPEEYLPKRLPMTEVVSLIFFIAAIIILIPLVMLTVRAFTNTVSLQVQVDRMGALVQTRQGTQNEILEMQSLLKKQNNKLDTFKKPLGSYLEQRENVSGDISIVTSLLPGTIELDSMRFTQGATGKRYNISGIATDEATILEYGQALRKTGHFDQVSISNIEVVDFNVVEFALELK
jgi:type IV pilus assembly protein PilM